MSFPRIILLLAFTAALAARAPATPQAPDPADELARIEAAVPPDAELVVTLHAAATARKTPAGRAAAAMVAELVGTAETGRTWAELAGILGWSSDEAFDQLLGRHVTLLVKGGIDRPADAGGVQTWAIIGLVSRETEHRLRERLKPVPRAVIGGTTVLAIESGKYRMALWGRPDAVPEDAPAAGPGASTYVLAPAGGAGLLDELIERLAAVRDEAAEGAPRALPSRAFASVLIRRPPGLAGAPFTLTLTAAIDAAGSGMDVRLACTGVSDPGLDLVTPWSDAAIRALSDDAFLATMGVVGLSPFQSAADILGLPRIDLAPAGLDALLGRRVALIVRESPAGQLAPAPPPAAAANAADRGFEGVLAAAGAARRPLSITLAIETIDLARTIPRADAMAARFTLPEAGGGDVELVAFDSGAAPSSVRELPLAGPAALDWSPVIGEEPVIRWAFAREPAARRAPAADPDGGWWIVGLAPGGTPAARGVESVRTALIRAGGDAADLRRVSAGFARPRAIERWAVSVDPRFAPLVRALRRVESVRWDAWLTADGGVDGRASIRWETTAPKR